MSVANWANYSQQSKGRAEHFKRPSLTVPGQTLSLKQLLDRYVKGQDVDVFTPQYSEDPDIPDNLEKMDTLEKLDLAQNIRRGIKSFREQIVENFKNAPKPEPSQPGVPTEKPVDPDPVTPT